MSRLPSVLSHTIGGCSMASARAQVGQRWLIRGLGWRVIIGIRSDRHGRLYGVRSTVKNYALTPVSAYEKNWGRFVRSRDLIRRDKRRKVAVIVSKSKKRHYRVGSDGPYDWERHEKPDSQGYTRLKLWNGYRMIWVYEHRYIMELALGRKLTTNEIVHHRNGDSKDNRMENLQLCCSKREHRLLHMEMRHRYEIEMTACSDQDGQDNGRVGLD